MRPQDNTARCLPCYKSNTSRCSRIDVEKLWRIKKNLSLDEESLQTLLTWYRNFGLPTTESETTSNVETKNGIKRTAEQSSIMIRIPPKVCLSFSYWFNFFIQSTACKHLFNIRDNDNPNVNTGIVGGLLLEHLPTRPCQYVTFKFFSAILHHWP